MKVTSSYFNVFMNLISTVQSKKIRQSEPYTFHYINPLIFLISVPSKHFLHFLPKQLQNLKKTKKAPWNKESKEKEATPIHEPAAFSNCNPYKSTTKIHSSALTLILNPWLRWKVPPDPMEDPSPVWTPLNKPSFSSSMPNSPSILNTASLSLLSPIPFHG